MKTKFFMLSCAFIFSLSLVTFSCKKYEEGPAVSFLSKKSRLSGDWKIESVTDNGTDITSSYSAMMGNNYVLNIEKSGSYRETGAASSEGTWELGEDKDDVTFKPSAAGSAFVTFRILRLKSKELWLRYSNVNGTYTIYKYKPAD